MSARVSSSMRSADAGAAASSKSATTRARIGRVGMDPPKILAGNGGLLPVGIAAVLIYELDVVQRRGLEPGQLFLGKWPFYAGGRADRQGAGGDLGPGRDQRV